MLALVLLVAVLAIGDGSAIYASADGVEVNFGGMRSNGDRVEFIEGFGVMVKDEPKTEEVFSAPDSFDRVIAGYNEIQKAQGLDLTKYRGKRITHYVYEVENYAKDGEVIVNLYVYKQRIIGCDLSSSDGGGVLLPLVGIDKNLFE